MRHHYIHIQSVQDIDTSRITLRSIENRYIDAQGRRYATRFNLRRRTIEIVPIALGREEARMAKRLFSGQTPQIDKAATKEETAADRIHPNPMKLPQWIRDMQIEPDTEGADLQQFLQTIEKEMQRNGERYRGLIQSLKASSILEDMKDGNQHDAILELTNTFERDIQEHAARVQTMSVEFLRFPKPLASYVGQIDRNCKKYVEKLDGEKQKRYAMAYLISNEMFGVFKGCKEIIEMVESFTKDAQSDRLVHDRKSAFEAAIETLQYLKDGLTPEIAKFLGLLVKVEVI